MEDDEYGPAEYFEFAEKAKALGMKIDLAEFKRLTKMTFIQDEEEWSPPQEETSKEWTVEEKDALRREVEEGA